MVEKIAAALAAMLLCTGAAFAQGAKPTDPQIAHIAYTAGVIDIEVAKQALALLRFTKAGSDAGFRMPLEHYSVIQ